MEKKMDKRSEVEITLDFPVQLADRLLERVTMRRPTVGDTLDYPVRDTSDMDGETKLYAKLCDLVPDELRLLDMADYGKLQKQFLLFRGISTCE